MSESLAGSTIAKRQSAEEGRVDSSIDDQDSIRLEAVSFKTPSKPSVTYGLVLPDGESISVEITVDLPEGRTGFNSYNEIFVLAWMKLSRWLDAMSSHARGRRPIAG